MIKTLLDTRVKSLELLREQYLEVMEPIAEDEDDMNPTADYLLEWDHELMLEETDNFSYELAEIDNLTDNQGYILIDLQYNNAYEPIMVTHFYHSLTDFLTHNSYYTDIAITYNSELKDLYIEYFYNDGYTQAIIRQVNHSMCEYFEKVLEYKHQPFNETVKEHTSDLSTAIEQYYNL